MNALELQRLVDGQLTHHQRADLLGSLKTDDPQWRELALRLLEEQQWSKEICLDPQTIPNEIQAESDSAKSIVKRNDFKENTKRRTNIYWNALLASCTLFAIGLYAGYQFRYHVKYPSAVAPLADSSNSIEYASPFKVRVESPSTTPIEIPLLDARDIDPKLIFANNSYEIAKLNQQLKRKGYELDIKPTVYSGSLQDGRKFVVPVHDVSLKPHGL
ncbi:MAG: hypothetical protein ACK6DQ_05085 [Planctomycetota bacterium]